MKLREQFEKEFNFVDKKEQPMFMSVKYIHWLEAKVKQLQKTAPNSDYVKKPTALEFARICTREGIDPIVSGLIYNIFFT